MMAPSRNLTVRRAEVPGVIAIPLRTPLVRPGDDLLAIVSRAVAGIARAGDVVAIAESAVAIAQGELIGAEHVRPSRLAFAIARRADPMATISQPESIQLVIDRVGSAKVVVATVLQFFGRLFGVRGLFYRLMGEAVAAFDGYTGTMPPYEQAIVLAPRDPNGFAQRLCDRIGVACAVVDANDLGKAKLLGRSAGVDVATVEGALLDNPHGYSDEQTPVVVLKWRGDTTNPLFERSAS
jgi:hypothetical protein